MVKAIEANQPDRAEHLARRHVQAARQAIKNQVADGSFVPHCVVESNQSAAPDNE